MDEKRAVEIIESLGVIGVNYKGNPVWLENVDEENHTVKVKDIKTDKELNVHTRELKEN